jgi:hypothetical protein
VHNSGWVATTIGTGHAACSRNPWTLQKPTETPHSSVRGAVVQLTVGAAARPLPAAQLAGVEPVMGARHLGPSWRGSRSYPLLQAAAALLAAAPQGWRSPAALRHSAASMPDLTLRETGIAEMACLRACQAGRQCLPACDSAPQCLLSRSLGAFGPWW